jgi:hypothetical protein
MMKKGKSGFANEKEFIAMSKLLESWKDDPRKLKSAFLKMQDKLLKIENTTLTFKSRPGVSYSLRASLKNLDKKNRPLLALVDIIDDDPKNRWLSICFYADMVTDPDEVGNLVPKGVLGEDGYCFDLDELDESMISYIEKRVDEANAHIAADSCSRPT